MSGTPYIEITWPAWRNILQRFQWNDDYEQGGGLFCWATKHHVEITEVMPNPVQSGTRYHVEIDTHHFLSQQKFYVPNFRGNGDNDADEDDLLFCGSIHSHPDGNARASDSDLDTWIRNAKIFPYFYAGLIVTADDRDWSSPRLSGWIATKDNIWAAKVIYETQADYALRRTVRFQPRRVNYGKK